jgi:hypothetical protein
LHTARGVILSNTADTQFRERKDGPRITAALSAYVRDDDRYWHRQPSDHGPDGLFAGGPKGESNPIARLQGFTHCVITASAPDAERRQQVVYSARDVAYRADEGLPPRPRTVMLGRFSAPRKPATSGRKRRAA